MAFSERDPTEGQVERPLARLVWLASTLVIAAAIGILTLMPARAIPPGLWGSDKLAHLLAFLALVFPTALLWPRVSAAVGLLAVVYGGVLEIIQPYAGRSAEFSDLVADGTGIGLGIVLGLSARRLISGRRAARIH